MNSSDLESTQNNKPPGVTLRALISGMAGAALALTGCVSAPDADAPEGELATLLQPPSDREVDAQPAMYAPAFALSEPGDRFGQVLALGDFDGDGWMDLAIGIPSEDTESNTVTNAGAVAVMQGTEDGFEPWLTLTQSSIGALEESFDGFGSALAVGDFDDDGIDDLAIGTPGESVLSTEDAGAVYLMRGTGTGLTFWRAVDQSDAGAAVEVGDRFGFALAVGDFDGDARDDLAVGAVGETHGDGIAAGRVYVLRGIGMRSVLAAWDSVGQEDLAVAPNIPLGGILPPPTPLGTHQSGDLFGSALAAGRIDEDGFDDLVVAASCDDELATCAGGVYLFRGGAAGMRGWMRLDQSTGGDANDRYGWSVAVGDLDYDSDDDILVGAPLDDVGGVTNVGRVYWAQPQAHVITGIATWNQENSDSGANDEFGWSIATGVGMGSNVIAIGARNESWGAGDPAGAVFLFRASFSGPPPFEDILRASPLSDEDASDEFGYSLAVYGEGLGEAVVVGNPGEDSSAGAVQTFTALFSNLFPFEQAQLLIQN